MTSIDKDLSYQGRTAKRQASLLQYFIDVQDELKIEKCKVALSLGGKDDGSIRLRYRTVSGQKKISPLGCEMTHSGIELARSYAVDIDRAIKRGTYTEEWLERDLLNKAIATAEVIPAGLTIGEFNATFSDRWFKYRSGDRASTKRQKQRTLDGYLGHFRRNFKKSALKDTDIFDPTLVTKLLDLHDEGTDKRFRLREALSVACNVFGIPYNFKGIGKKPKPIERELPTDNQILEAYQLFDKIVPRYPCTQKHVDTFKWVFGLIATYGLRPQEAYAINLDESFKPETDFWLSLDQSITDGLKTGNRWMPPLMPEWVELFQITVPIPLVPHPLGVEHNVHSIGKFINHHKIGYTVKGEFIAVPLYNLRHAYAIRCRREGIGLLDAAAHMGHDPATHQKQYHRWITIDDRIASHRAALARNNNP